MVGVQVHAIDYEKAVDRIIGAAKRREPMSIAAVSVHGVMMSVKDRTHRYRLNKLDLVVPDGQPVRWALNLIHRAKLRERVYGPQMMYETICRAAEEGVPIFLFGGYQLMLDDLKRELLKRLPNLKIAGMNPAKYERVSPEEQAELVKEIKESGAQILFGGPGSPKQEVFVYEMRETLSMPALAVGAALNFHAGHLPQAPRTMQRYGLEWLFRLSKEPRRLWRRYLLVNPLYLGLFALQATGLYTIEPASAQAPQQELRYG